MNPSGSSWRAIGRAVLNALSGRARQSQRPAASVRSTDYPGDFTGRFEITYQPNPDGVPDPGEVVWTWVPYEEDHSVGKDRPVLIVGRDRGWLLAVAMTSKDHDSDAGQEARAGRFWVDIGRGDWDRSGRASEVRVNRIIRVNPASVRRIASRLDQQRFAKVAEGIRRHW